MAFSPFPGTVLSGFAVVPITSLLGRGLVRLVTTSSAAANTLFICFSMSSLDLSAMSFMRSRLRPFSSSYWFSNRSRHWRTLEFKPDLMLAAASVQSPCSFCVQFLSLSSHSLSPSVWRWRASPREKSALVWSLNCSFVECKSHKKLSGSERFMISCESLKSSILSR